MTDDSTNGFNASLVFNDSGYESELKKKDVARNLLGRLLSENEKRGSFYVNM